MRQFKVNQFILKQQTQATDEMKHKSTETVEVNVGPQTNSADTVESIEINERTNLICNCSKASMIKKNPNMYETFE